LLRRSPDKSPNLRILVNKKQKIAQPVGLGDLVERRI
jgi:hypothetical protein